MSYDAGYAKGKDDAINGDKPSAGKDAKASFKDGYIDGYEAFKRRKGK